MLNNNLQEKLNRFRSSILDESSTSHTNFLSQRYTKLADTLGGEVVETHTGTYCLVRQQFPIDNTLVRHGTGSPTETDRQSLPIAAFTAENSPARVDLSSLVFVDTETTGLGGAGTVAFLIGCGSIVGEQFEVRQFMLPDYADEAAMLETVLGEFGTDKTIVSYNGMSFDLPLIRDRFIVNRVAREVPMQQHLDLLHTVRRYFRRRLRDCTLINVERELLGFYRGDDVPGYLIPSVYFEWFASESLELMPTVLSHNQRDIVSLYYIARVIAEAFESEGATLSEVDDMYSLARLFGRRKEHRRVTKLLTRVEDFPDNDNAEVLLYQSMAYKRMDNYEQAVTIWQRIIDLSTTESFHAAIELAKHFEHRERDILSAVNYAESALRIGPPNDRQRQHLHKRLRRLKAKQNSA